MTRLIPGIRKCTEKYISEHMLIHRGTMWQFLRDVVPPRDISSAKQAFFPLRWRVLQFGYDLRCRLWLGRDFYAISFEKGDTVRKDQKNLVDNRKYQEELSTRRMLRIAQEQFEEGGYLEVWEK